MNEIAPHNAISRISNARRISIGRLLLIAGPVWAQDPTPAGDGVITIEVGSTSVPRMAQSWFENEIRSFMRAHPSIRVETINLVEPIRPYTSVEALPRLADNVVGIQSGHDDALSYFTGRELIRPLSAFLPDPEFDVEAVRESALRPISYDG